MLERMYHKAGGSSQEMLTSFQYSPLPTMPCLCLLLIDQLRQDRVMVLPAVQHHPFSTRQCALMAHKHLVQVSAHACDGVDLEGYDKLSAVGVLPVVRAVVLPFALLAVSSLLYWGSLHTECH